MTNTVYVCIFHAYMTNQVEVLGVFSSQEKARKCIVNNAKWMKDKVEKKNHYEDKGSCISGCITRRIGYEAVCYNYDYYYTEQVIDIRDNPEEYVKYFKKHFGYEKDFFPTEGYREVANLLDNEIKLNLPIDTAAMEKEGKAVMLLVLSNDKEAVSVGMQLGNIMMQKPINVHELLLTMKDASRLLHNLPDRRKISGWQQ